MADRAPGPACICLHCLTDRQRVKKFIRHPKQGHFRQLICCFCQPDIHAAEPVFQTLLQIRAGLQEGDRGGGHLRTDLGPDAVHIGKQRTASGPGLKGHHFICLRPAGNLPQPGQKGGHNLAEHLADLRGGDKITCLPEPVIFCIITVCAAHHALQKHLQRNPPASVDLLLQLVSKAHGRLCLLHQIIPPRPAAIIGRHNSWPIDSPAASSPICASGARTNSTINRASP